MQRTIRHYVCYRRDNVRHKDPHDTRENTHISHLEDRSDNGETADNAEDSGDESTDEAKDTSKDTRDVDVESYKDVGADVEDGRDEDFDRAKDRDEESVDGLDEGSLCTSVSECTQAM